MWTLADKTLSRRLRVVIVNDVGMQNLRIERNHRLQLTDKFANSDLTMADDMRTYRQALRDLPAGVSDPFDFDWQTYLTRYKRKKKFTNNINTFYINKVNYYEYTKRIFHLNRNISIN